MRTSQDFQGMRWFKCDLHVHTPEDGCHWSDKNLRLLQGMSETFSKRLEFFLKNVKE